MKFHFVKHLMLVAPLVCMNSVAQADEVWDSNVGQYVYAEEIGPTAVWTFGDDDNPGAVFILGLAGVYKNRGAYDGYWTRAKSRVRCRTQRMGADKKPTHFWGRFQLHFIDKNFPSRWVARWSYCNSIFQDTMIRATPAAAQPNAN